MEGRETNTRRLLEVLSERVQVEEIRKRMVEQVRCGGWVYVWSIWLFVGVG